MIDAARQWDKWADYPNVVTSIDYLIAVNNVNWGDMLPYAYRRIVNTSGPLS